MRNSVERGRISGNKRKDWQGYKNKTFAQRISANRVCKKVGLSQTHFSNVENGRVMLSLKKMFEVSELLECTMNDLLHPDRYFESMR